MLWRCLAVLLVLPWLAAPFVKMMPRPNFALPELTSDLPAAAGLSVTITAPPIGAAIFSAPPAPASWLAMSWPRSLPVGPGG